MSRLTTMTQIIHLRLTDYKELLQFLDFLVPIETKSVYSDFKQAGENFEKRKGERVPVGQRRARALPTALRGADVAAGTLPEASCCAGRPPSPRFNPSREQTTASDPGPDKATSPVGDAGGQ